MNFVLILTDSQSKCLVGAYGQPQVSTPHLDRLAAGGMRFERAYTTSPVCTPARSAIFSGLHPQVNGAFANNLAPHAHLPLMGTIFRQYGYRAAYTGKWHLDGTDYWGAGEADGGFESEWWYDGRRYADSIGPEKFSQYGKLRTPDELDRHGFDASSLWGHGVANRAVDFLHRVGSDPFLLVASFDEPHEPCYAPSDYWRNFSPEDLPAPRNYGSARPGKPGVQQQQAAEHGEVAWTQFAQEFGTRFGGCNRYVDSEIGRILEAVEKLHPETTILFTSDHGDQIGAHGLREKGPMMYEESTNVPLIIRVPEGPSGVVGSLVSQVDLLPTMLELAGIEVPPALQGTSLVPLLRDPTGHVREQLLVSFNRFAINHDGYGGFYPIRCAIDGRFKLAVNLFDRDEFYDLEADPLEQANRIDAEDLRFERDRLHRWLLAEMDHIRDPMRGTCWSNRPWSRECSIPYSGAPNRPRADGFPFNAFR